MKKILIAEISNQHKGSLSKAKTLIYEAKRCGADIVKGQAFRTPDMLKCGSMSKGFYEQCELSLQDYISLIEFGKRNEIDVFFTVISAGFSCLYSVQKYKKHHAMSIAKRSSLSNIENNSRIFASTYDYKYGMEKNPRINWMYATEYLKTIDKKKYEEILLKCNNSIDLGISHHAETYDLINFLKKTDYNIPVIEKHFYLGDDIYDEYGMVYRDCLHAANTDQFKDLAKTYKG